MTNSHSAIRNPQSDILPHGHQDRNRRRLAHPLHGHAARPLRQLRAAHEFSRLRAAFRGALRLRYLRRQPADAGVHERRRPDDHQLRHRLAQRGDGHGSAHGLSSRSGAVSGQVRRAEARHRDRALHPADRRDPRRRNVRRLPAAAGARACRRSSCTNSCRRSWSSAASITARA